MERPMAYIRTKGNQLAVVHGVREPETGKVQQKTLFTLYSKAEALAATGEQQHHFRRLLEDDNPGIRFDWKKLEAGIRDNLDHLPDLYPYKKERVESGFREALCTFSRELLLTDPQLLFASARSIQANRHELAWLRELIDFRLATCDQDVSEWNQDNPFYWRLAGMRRHVPPGEWEKLSALYARRQYDEAEALARLLTECWPDFARGFNYLGLIAMRRGLHRDAIEHFDEAMRVGRSAFPRRIRKDRWWSDHDTRPYIRAIIYKAQALNHLGDHTGALQLCERLECECHQEIAAAVERAVIYLCCGRWEDACRDARSISELYPEYRFVLAFALAEVGDPSGSLTAFLRAAIKSPRAAHILLGLETDRPENTDTVLDHNAGVDLRERLEAYLQQMGPETGGWFSTILESSWARTTIDEYREVRRRWREDRTGDRSWFRRMGEMESEPFARATAEVVMSELEGRSIHR